MNSTSQVIDTIVQRRVSITRKLSIGAQLMVAIWITYHYQIEGRALLTVLSLTAVGFAMSVVTPQAYRLPLFVILSLCGIVVVLGFADGTWVIFLGLVLIGICHIPVRATYRVLVLVATGILLALLKARWDASPWSGAMWPVLGSMFMFRLILYVRSIQTKQPTGGFWNTLGYFFMLPNLAFPLFPIVDHQVFRRSYFDRQENEIYEEGLLWISRGLVHLILYRLVYGNYLNDPTQVATLGDLVQFMQSTFLLYLHVSGQFHIAVGVLHLFGFRLPETNRFYYLSAGFTDLWRRMNIYWTEFMTKAVFYPAFFRLKGLGQVRAIAWSTAVVFVITWLLHSYQWFWLRGGFPVKAQDIVFWSVLGTLVIRGVINESTAPKAVAKHRAGWNWRRGFRAGGTFMLMCFLWSLWSIPTLPDWFWLLSAALAVDAKGIVLLLAALSIITILAAWEFPAPSTPRPRFIQLALSFPVRSAGGLLALLLLAQPAVREAMPAKVASALDAVQTAKLNSTDRAAQNRGYYELLDREGPDVDSAQTSDSKQLVNRFRQARSCELEFHSKRWQLQDTFLMFDLTPSLHLSYPSCWTRQMTFSTNSWGMRDREYTLAKQPGTFRIVISGQSHVMGNGVSDGETFEQLVEDRLNREFSCSKYRHFEILNLSADAYTLVQQLALIDQRGFRFAPDITIMTIRVAEHQWTRDYLTSLSLNRLTVPYGNLHGLLRNAGLDNIDLGDVAIPFPSWRRLAKQFGIQPRMPTGELKSRAERAAEQFNDSTWHEFAQVSAAHGATALALAVDVPFDEPASTVPNARAIQDSGVPLIDLLHIYPAQQREMLRVSTHDDHPNADGHRFIAEHLYQKLKPFIEAKCLE